MVLTLVRSTSGVSGLQMDASRSIRVGKFHQGILKSGLKDKNLAGWFRIKVLVVGLSWFGAFEKHALLVFILNLNLGISIKWLSGMKIVQSFIA